MRPRDIIVERATHISFFITLDTICNIQTRKQTSDGTPCSPRGMAQSKTGESVSANCLDSTGVVLLSLTCYTLWHPPTSLQPIPTPIVSKSTLSLSYWSSVFNWIYTLSRVQLVRWGRGNEKGLTTDISTLVSRIAVFAIIRE